MKNILILPDTHGREFWKEPCSKVDDFEKIVFLGDYLDPYPYEGINIEQSIENFKEILKLKDEHDDKVILLIGNHDAHYFNDVFHRLATGSRYNYKYSDVIKELFDANKDKFSISFGIKIQDKEYILSHAGATKGWYDKNKNLIGNLTSDNLNKLGESNEGWVALSNIGGIRGGRDKFGGLLWCDVYEHISKMSHNVSNLEYEHIDGVYQIFGHTQLEHPLINSEFACIDVRKAFVLDTENGKVTEYTE